MPGPVDDYFEKVKKDNPSYSDSQAWATAWSIYCKHKNPGSDHCKKPTSEYLKGKSAMDEMVLRVAASVADPEMAKRVAARAIEALSLGKTFESDKWRVHRSADFLVVTHLENAGKRGKKCVVMTLETTFTRAPALVDAVALEVAAEAKKNVSLPAMEKVMEDLVSDHSGAGSFGAGLRLSRKELRGVDVIPAGFGPLSIQTKKVLIDVTPKHFSIRNMNEGREIEVPDGKGGKKKVMDYPNMPTCIPTTGASKGMPVFYRWVKDNESKVKTMSYDDLLNVLKDLEIPYRTYCGMD